MRILVTGTQGQLGYEVQKELEHRDIQVLAPTMEELDITDEAKVSDYFAKSQPEAVIHCAAYTNVDKAEDEEELCFRVNVKGTEYLAKACAEHHAKLLYISTDYVFDGSGNHVWQTDSEPRPLSVYGKSKWQGELAVQQYLSNFFIVRITWLFGNGINFIKKILQRAEQMDTLSVVDDQIGSPTYAKDLAVLLCDMIESEKYGIYHATNEGFCSCYEFAKEILRQSGSSAKVVPVDSSQFPVKAERPKNSRLSKDKLEQNGFRRLPVWQDALERYLKSL